MANLKSDGKIFDANLIIQTGITLTAGSLIWCDVSGTNVVHPVRAYSGTSPETNILGGLDDNSGTGRGIASLDAHGTSGSFLGVIAKTQTGLPNLTGGNQTGVTWYPQGVFEFGTTPTASCQYIVGLPVWANRHDQVFVGASGLSHDQTGHNTTGSNPIGYISYLPRGPVTTNTTVSRVRVYVNAHINRGGRQY